MTKGRRKSTGENQAQLLLDERTVLSELRRKAASLSNVAQRIMDDLEKGVSLARLKPELLSLRQDLSTFQSMDNPLGALELSWARRIDHETLEMEATLRDALRGRAWQVDGQWPKLYVE